MEESYKISLGIDLNEAELNTVKNVLKSIEKQERKVEYNVDFNITNLDKLTKVGAEIDKIKGQIKELSNTGKNKSVLSFDSKSLKASIDTIHNDIKKLQNAFGRVDDNKGVQSLLTTVNKIRASLEGVSKQFEALNKSLSSLSTKDLSLNFDFGIGKSNSKSPEQIASELRMLKKEAEEYEKYLAKIYKVEKQSSVNPVQRMVAQNAPRNQIYFHQLQNAMLTGAPSQQQIAAYKEYINLIKQTAAAANIDLSPVEFRLGESGEFVKVRNEVSETKKELQELFSGGINAESLHKTLSEIADDLRKIKGALTDASSDAPINQLIESFNRLSGSVEDFVKNVSQARQAIDNGIGDSSANNGTETAIQQQNELSQASAQSANVVVQSEERKQQAFRETAAEAKKLDEVSIDISGGNVNDVKNALKNLRVDDASIENATKELNELNIVAKNVSGTLRDGKLAKWEIKGVQTTADGLERVVTITKTLGQEGWMSTTKYSQALDKISVAAEKVKDKLKGDNGKTKFDVEIGDVETKFAKLSNQSEELSERIAALRRAFENVKVANAKDDIEGLVAANERYEQALQDVHNQLTLNQQAEERARKEEKRVFDAQSLETAKANALSRLENLFEEGSEAARIYGVRVEELRRKIEACGDTRGVADLNKQITTLGREIDRTNSKTDTFATRFKKQWSQYSEYFSVASVFMYVEQGLRSMFEQVKLIDSAMTELKKVTNETDASYNQFLSKAASRSKELGTTIDGLVSSTADFARLGYSFEESQGLAEVANIYAVVGDEIDGVEDATQSLVSTLAAFKKEMGDMSDSEFAMSIVDKMNEVSNNFAISSGGIGEALQRSASSMAAANNSLDETIAMITAANEVAQNPEKVGNAFKTMSMRIRGAKTQLEEMGESTEGMAESTASLREEIKALSGVDIMLND